MADNTPQNGTANIAADDITTMNGGTITAGTALAQRMKIGYGADSFFRDVEPLFPLPAYKPNRSATGSLTTLNSAVSLVLDGDGDVSMDIVVTALVGTIIFEQRLPTGAWYPVNATLSSTSGPVTTYVNPTSGLYRLSSGGTGEVRVRVSAFTSGSATVLIGSSASSNAVYLNQIAPMKLFDGTNSGILKGGSTAAAAGDASLVVAFSPNSPTPPGANFMGSVGLTLSSVAITARPDGFQRVLMDPTTLLFDTFESLDTTNTWTLGGSVNPTAATGVLTIAANATVSATSYAQSKPAFTPGSNAYLQFASLITIDGSATTGTNRFWGLGVISGPTVTAPITNGTIFEVDTTGALFGSAYSGGARTQNVALTKPTDAAAHRYAIYYKASRAYFEIDNVSVGSLPFPNPVVSALPTVIGQINSGTVTGTNTLTSTLMGVADTGRNAIKIADGLFPWRVQTVKPASTAAAATDLPAVVALHPTSPLPTGSNVVGALVANQSVNTAQVAGTAVATGSGVVGAGVQRFVLASDVALPAGANIVGALVANQSTNTAQVGGTAIATGTGVTGAGVQRITWATDVGLPTGANIIGALTANQTVNVSQMNGVAVTMGSGVTGTGVQRVVLATDVPLPNPSTPTAYVLSSSANTNLVSVKGSAGTLYSCVASNNGAAAAFLKLYNLNVAPTLASSVPVLIVPIPPSSVVSLNLGVLGQRFSAGIAHAITNLVADTDATAVVAGQVKVMASYI